ncbi:MAG: PilZ domain-containing protein [Candidatus Omnitrophica bacterium]|nr:PilZ domain-containing protein [Candidatus Omnitrophota bacterium]
MDNQRKLIRLETSDFLQVKPINEVGRIYEAEVKDFTFMGICFSSSVEWKKGQVLALNYFLSQSNQPVKMKMVVIWSEFIGSKQGYFCGGQITSIEEKNQAEFAHYYYKKLKEKSSQ